MDLHLQPTTPTPTTRLPFLFIPKPVSLRVHTVARNINVQVPLPYVIVQLVARRTIVCFDRDVARVASEREREREVCVRV